MPYSRTSSAQAARTTGPCIGAMAATPSLVVPSSCSAMVASYEKVAGASRFVSPAFFAQPQIMPRSPATTDRAFCMRDGRNATRDSDFRSSRPIAAAACRAAGASMQSK